MPYVTRPDDGTYRRRTTASETFLPDEAERPFSTGPDVFKFPLDDISAGNFWTRLIVNSWLPVRPGKEIVPKQAHRLNRYGIANIWLPMPLALSTAYNQNYSEEDNMMVNRGTGMNFESISGGFATFWDQIVKGAKGAVNELGEAVSSMANVNNSGRMNLGSIWNQQMGLVYDGASLRAHTFSWKMTPKNQAEQDAIQQVVFALKIFSSPIVKAPLGGEVNFETASEALEDSMANVRANDPELADVIANADIGDTMRNLGRLGIPATINVEFWYGDKVNPHLFQVKDSFITSVEVNYTPTGTWNAYEDGAPIETQLTLNLKENAIITQNDIKNSGGY